MSDPTGQATLEPEFPGDTLFAGESLQGLRVWASFSPEALPSLVLSPFQDCSSFHFQPQTKIRFPFSGPCMSAVPSLLF